MSEMNGSLFRQLHDNPEEFHSVLAEWFHTRGFAAVSFREESVTTHDPNDDYMVVYQVVFDPTDINQARVELWLTDDGLVAVGIDTTDRLAERLGKRIGRKGFVAGHEPVEVELPAILKLLDLVAGGHVGVVGGGGVLGFRPASALLSSDAYDQLAAAGYGYLDWVETRREGDQRRAKGIIEYHAWS